MKHHSDERRVVTIFVKNNFPANFCQKRPDFFDFFSKQIRQSPLPYAILKIDALFLQKYLKDPFAYCLAALAKP